jgi:aquaporin Z
MDLINPNTTCVSTALKSRPGFLESISSALKRHWPEYLMEATGLGFFMLSACTFTVLFFHPSYVAGLVPSEVVRRALMGIAMGLTAIAIIFSPVGKRSGAHINPSVTLTFLRLGKVKPCDAAFYTLFQFIGAVAGVLLAGWLMGDKIAHRSVSYATTVPGQAGWQLAFVAEVGISFAMMLVVLTISNSKTLSRWTGIFVGFIVANYITFESPISGMSMNPARTLGSASVAQIWTALWIYFIAPPIGMLLAAEVYLRVKAGRGVACAKLHHHNNQRCIFNCNFQTNSF